MPAEDKDRKKPASTSSTESQAYGSTLVSGSGPAREEQGDQGPAWGHATTIPPVAPEILEGRTVIKERFVLEELLGFGGMGTVYKARDLRKVEAQDRDPWVAVKLLNDELKKHPAALISLQREARRSQILTHPNIVKVFDFDRDGEIVFMTMELLRGLDLKHHIREHPLGLEKKEVVPITRQMGEALQHAHDNGIIHADFSPKNVFLTERGEAKVVDFGIAQAIAVADAKVAASEQTVFDPATLGGVTPGYASFEQLTGKEPVPADDVFALGCVVYQLLCGDHPHQEKTAVEAVSMQIHPRRTDKLSGKQWRALQKAMALLREERYPTVVEFLEDFAPRANPATRPTAIAAGIVLAIVAAGAYQAYSTYREKQTRNAELLAQQKDLVTSRERLEQEQARKSQQTARELERINREYLALAEVLIASDQHDEAEKYLEQVRASMPGHPGLSTVQSLLEQSRVAHQQRIVSQQEVRLEIDHLLEKIQTDIAQGKLVRPFDDSAYSAYQKIIALEPDNVQARTVLQRLVQLHLDGLDRSLRFGELQDAAVWLNDLATIAPGNQNLSRFRSELERAVAVQRKRDNRIKSLLRQANSLTGEGSAERRRDIYLQILELEALNPEAMKGLERARAEFAQAEQRLHEQAQQDARALLQHAVDLFDKRPVEAANYRRAHEYLLAAQKKSPGLTEVDVLIEQLPQRYIQTIEGRIAAKEYEKADEFVQAAIVLAPQNTSLLRLKEELAELARQKEPPVLPSSF